jgi:hypothetical protein
MAGQRDALINIIAKAVNTGYRPGDVHTKTRGDGRFFAGRVTAFVYAAAIMADQCYGRDFEQVKKVVRTMVEDVRSTWPEEDLRDADKVGKAADSIVTTVLRLDR